MSDTISVLGKANKADIRTDPFPHLVVEDALSPELFHSLIENFPPTDLIAGNRVVKSNGLRILSARDVAEMPEIAEVWRPFFDYHTSRPFFFDMANFWQEYIAEAYPTIEADLGKPITDFTTGVRHPGERENPANLAQDIQLDCQLGINTAVETPSSVRGPHVDSGYKLITGLLYFRDPDDDSVGGDFQLFRFLDPDFHYQHGKAVDRRVINDFPVRRLTRMDSGYVELVKSVPYAANVLVMWLNTPYTVHGVSPRQPTPWTRRYVNFLCEVYGGQNNGFFETKRQRRWWPSIIR